MVKHEYTATGYLSKVFDAQQTSKTYWQANIANARGQIESFTLGNGLTTTIGHNPQKGYITGMLTPGIQNFTYTFNTVGNLTDRKDNAKSLTEHFDYDGLNRLWKVSHNGILQQEIGYDAAGNITTKTGVGSSFAYYPGTNRLKSVSGNGYTPANWDQISYSSFNKIISVSQGGNSLTLTYGVSKERKKSVTVKNGVTETRYYVGSLFEEVYIGNEIRQINHIFGGNGAVAIFESSSTTGSKLRYLHKDHLGSVMAYSNETGQLVQELSYDAWGRRRNPADWAYYPALTDANAWHARGFTGQEHLDLFEMVNMNGRMYDPVLGRFLSADPYVQAPDYTQSLNRYAYCLNNPLSLLDPSGYSWFSKNWKSLVSLRAICSRSAEFKLYLSSALSQSQISATVGIVVTVASGGLGSIVLAGALGGAAAGLSGALLNGTNFAIK